MHESATLFENLIVATDTSRCFKSWMRKVHTPSRVSALRAQVNPSARARQTDIFVARFMVMPNDRVERPHEAPVAACRASQQSVGNQGAAPDGSRSAPTCC